MTAVRESVIRLLNRGRAADGRGGAPISPDVLTAFVIFGLTLALIFGSRVVSASFGTLEHVVTIFELASFLVVVAFGQGLVILVRGLDLSIPSMITLGGILTTSWIGTSDGVWYLIPLVLGICFVAGLVSGLGVTLLKVPPFIMTLASGLAVYSICLGYTHGSPRGEPPPVLVDLMRVDWLGWPAVAWFVLAFAVVGALLQGWTVYGRYLYAVGNNPEAARATGLPVGLLTASAYAVSAMCAGWTGMMLVGYSRGATLNMGDDYLLPSIAAVVIGGSSILGGKGNYIGTVGGALLLTTLGILIAAIGLSQGWRMIIEGSIILLALLMLREGMFEALRLPRFGAARAMPGSET